VAETVEKLLVGPARQCGFGRRPGKAAVVHQQRDLLDRRAVEAECLGAHTALQREVGLQLGIVVPRAHEAEALAHRAVNGVVGTLPPVHRDGARPRVARIILGVPDDGVEPGEQVVLVAVQLAGGEDALRRRDVGVIAAGEASEVVQRDAAEEVDGLTLQQRAEGHVAATRLPGLARKLDDVAIERAHQTPAAGLFLHNAREVKDGLGGKLGVEPAVGRGPLPVGRVGVQVAVLDVTLLGSRQRDVRPRRAAVGKPRGEAPGRRP